MYVPTYLLLTWENLHQVLSSWLVLNSAPQFTACSQYRLGIYVMQDVLDAGKVKAIGVSEVSADELRIIHSIVPVKVVELEWSLFARKNEVGGWLPCCSLSSKNESCMYMYSQH